MSDRLPRSLRYSVQRALNTKRVTEKIMPNSSTVVRGSGKTIFTFPDAVYDPRTISLFALQHIGGQTVGTRVGTCTALYKWIESITFYANGVKLADIKNYNLIKNMMLKVQHGIDYANSNLTHNYIEDYDQKTGAAGAGADVRGIEDNILSCMFNGYYNSAIWGVLTMEVVWASNEFIKGGVAVAAANAKGPLYFELSDIYLLVDVISVPSVYLDLLSERLKSAPIELAFLNIQSEQQAGTGTNQVNFSTNCLDALAAFVINPRNVNGAGHDVDDEYVVGQFNSTGCDNVAELSTRYFQFKINQEWYPKEQMSAWNAYDQAVNVWCGKQDPYNRLGLDETGENWGLGNFATLNHFLTVKTCLEESGFSPEAQMTGLSGNGSPLRILFRQIGYPTDSSKQWMICGFCTGVLSRDANGKIVAEY